MTRGPLRRSRSNRMLAGVVGGLAEWLGIDPTVARVVYVVGSILELSVHPALITLDALNNGHGSLEDGELVLKRSVAS